MRPSMPVLAVAALLLLPSAAAAAPVKISPRPAAVSTSGSAAIEVANPNRHPLRGTATVKVGRRTIARRNVRLARRSVSAVVLRFKPAAMAALSAAGGRARMTLRLRRDRGRTATVSRKLTLRLAPVAPEAPGGGSPDPTPSQGGAGGSSGSPSPPTTPPDSPAPPASGSWVGRMGTEGDYDDLALVVSGGRLQFTKAPTVPVYCFENGGSYRSALSFELFAASGPWTVGTDETVAGPGIAVNQLVSAGERTINYKVTGTAQEARRITGTLGMSFSDSRYDVFTNTITFINCSGAQSFEAVPAG